MCNIYKASAGHSRSCPNSCSSCYNGSLVTWTAAKCKPLCRASPSPCRERSHCHDFVWPLLVACTITLRNHKYMVLYLESHVLLEDRCTRWKVTPRRLSLYSLCTDHMENTALIVLLLSRSVPSDGCLVYRAVLTERAMIKYSCHNIMFHTKLMS
jgi:hypothetical protein